MYRRFCVGGNVQKIISLFKRDYEGTRQVFNEVVPGAEWVLNGEGVATVKWDGTSCTVRGGILYKRYDAKHGKTPPPGFEPAQEPDPITGHWPGWVPVTDAPEDRWHRAALEFGIVPGYDTYELIGPKVQGNPHGYDRLSLVPHGQATLPDAPRTFDAIKAYLEANPIFEGIVWHHPDGRMVKIKRRDFGLPWPVKRERP